MSLLNLESLTNIRIEEEIASNQKKSFQNKVYSTYFRNLTKFSNLIHKKYLLD